MSLLLIEVQGSGYLDLASLSVEVVLLFEEAGNCCSECCWMEMSWSCVLAMGCFLPGAIQACVGVQWWTGHTEISLEQKSPLGEVKLCWLYYFSTCILLSKIQLRIVHWSYLTHLNVTKIRRSSCIVKCNSAHVATVKYQAYS